ncbi:conserved hypothetical protein [uncultured Paludibacter sp.]|uniref:Uncharacterized protein n=1 Tax=uncultured Paludibacter sp. TaxID=497635 RepID=A0A653ABF8_9BACT|nr:conserved hypothetical protein [uncultured Paludibacter sp.]
MKKKIDSLIQSKSFVKVFIDKEDVNIEKTDGIIMFQNENFIVMSDTYDFFYCGMKLIRKKDISEIRNSDNEKVFNEIMKAEKLTDLHIELFNKYKIDFSDFKSLFNSLKFQNLPIIIECQYGKNDRFILGSIFEINEKNVRIEYINSRAEYDLIPTKVLYKDITTVCWDGQYTNLFYKYAKRIE